MPRASKKYHYVYKTTCVITGRYYVGMHSTNDLDDVYMGSGKLLRHSRRKYGDENHKTEILEFCSSRNHLKEREKEIVNEELLKDPLNINLKYGGEGGWDHKPGVNIQLQQIDALARARNAAKTRRLRRLDPKYAEKHSRKISESMKGKQTFLGHRHSEETRMKMRKSKNVGSSNSQFGTAWVTDGVKPIKINKELLEEYLQKGYSRGRLFTR